MSKRKEATESIRPGHEDEESSSEDSGSQGDTNMLDVDFEWFDPQEQDYDGIKTLLRQLFDIDAQIDDIKLSSLTDLILAQPLLGSTVKVEVDATEKNLFAFLSVLNIKEHEAKPAIQSLKHYLIGRACSCSDETTKTNMTTVLRDSTATVGLILTERMINAPSEIVPPMYQMLLEEMKWALEENEPFNFTHYLVISKTYQEIVSDLDQEDDGERHRKKQKKTKKEKAMESFFFHPEDEILHRYASAFGDFNYMREAANGQSDSKRAFQDMGIKPNGHMILIDAPKFEAAVKAMQEAFGQS